MLEKTSRSWLHHDLPPIEGAPFDLVRSTCRQAARTARDAVIDHEALQRFIEELDVEAIRDVMKGSLGENCDTLSDEFDSARDAVNFALLFCLLQFGHGFRHELHRYCGRGASRTITQGVRSLHLSGDLGYERLLGLNQVDVRTAFGLPDVPELDQLARQLYGVIHNSALVLQKLGLSDFDAFLQMALEAPEAETSPSETLAAELARNFPAFDDQGLLRDGSRVVLIKKASLATGEVCRLAAPHDARYDLCRDLDRVTATVDNVIPAMLVYKGVIKLSPTLHRIIYEEKKPLPHGPLEAELRAVSLDVCERLVAAHNAAFTALDIGYYLWLAGKEPQARQFPRHHTKDTVFY